MIIKCITLKLNFNSVNESMPLFSQWLLWNCKLRLCECSWRLMDNLSTWSYKDWKATFRSHTMFHHPEGWPRAKTCIRWNNQDFPSRHFYCWIIKPCARGEAVSELGKTLNWIDLKATIELQLFFNLPLGHYIDNYAEIVKHENKSKSAWEWQCLCTVGFSGNQGPWP